MQPPSIPGDEAARLERLYRLDIMDTPAEELYDDITRLAAMYCGTLFSTVTLVDRDRQWFKAATGPLDTSETSREHSFCGHAVVERQLFVVEDTLEDDRFHDNPFVQGGPMIRFYAGAPLITSDGLVMGTLCVFDPRPKQLDEPRREALTLLAKQVTDRLESRLHSSLASMVGRILDSSDMYVVMLDTRNDFVNYSNQAFNQRAGHYPRSARGLVKTMLPGLNYDRIVPQSHSDGVSERFLQTEVHFSKADRLLTELRLMTLTEHGRRMLLVLFQDKSALRASESEARKARSNLRVFSQLANQSKNQVIITDHTGAIEWVNPSFEKATGYTLEEVRGRVPGQFLQGPATAPGARERLRKHLREAEPVVQEILNYTKKGEPYWIELYIEPIRDDTGTLTHFVATQTNVTQRKEHEQAIREARDAAERANRAKSQFLANISHELRTPLNGIMGVTDLLQDQASGHLSRYIRTLDHSSKHLLRLLNDILDLSHIESGHLKLRTETFELEPLLEEVEQLFTPRAKAVGTEMVLTMTGATGLAVEGDPTRVRQVVMNLVSNAVKFTHNGRVTLHAHSRRCGPEQVEVALAVTDTGPGIPAAEQERIFGHFEQLDNSSTRVHGGSGLGLAISRQIVRLMGGDIKLASEAGKGARFSFTLTLPLAQVSEKETVTAASAGQEPALVLVVDDNEINREILTSMLHRRGIDKVHTATSGTRGLALMENLQPDIIFADIQMPEMDGYGFLAHVQALMAEQHRPLPALVACTADTSESQRQEALDAGFNAHLGKPITGTNLAEVLTSLGFLGSCRTGAEPQADVPPVRPDMLALRQAFDNSDELLSEFLKLFQNHHPDHLERIETALTEGKPASGATSAHTLKGLLGYFALPELVACATSLQDALAGGDQSASESLFRDLKKKIAELNEGLRAVS
ncbi:MAG: ATP-binding protein [Marinobacter sp.]|uniref:ATP-binding protein n=1 Tax=Marinobacter sp. TaxID=50741 RepID=UPI00299CE31C|nr:ATP-binding protein [Marinobacter sp.]MDX1635160.1 ATP-binding protein [Marinobacter sp.]